MSNQNIFEQIEQMSVSLDDTFRFHCTACGKCCTNRDDILLSPSNVYRIAKELKMRPVEICQKYCEIYVGDSSRFPIVRIKPQGADRHCPFLKEKKCIIHNAKPSVCAMYPLGRFVKLGADEFGKPSSMQVHYILQEVDCGDKSETHTVREWISKFNMEEEDDAFLLFNQAVSVISKILIEAEKKQGSSLMMNAWNQVFIHLYLEYDLDKPFIPQFKENVEHVLEAIHYLRMN